MMAEMRQVKRFLGIKFGYGEIIEDGVLAIPTTTSKGNAFMRMEMKNGKPHGNDNYMLFWDEQLEKSWYNNPKPKNLKKESEFSRLFRQIDSLV